MAMAAIAAVAGCFGWLWWRADREAAALRIEHAGIAARREADAEYAKAGKLGEAVGTTVWGRTSEQLWQVPAGDAQSCPLDPDLIEAPLAHAPAWTQQDLARPRTVHDRRAGQ